MSAMKNAPDMVGHIGLRLRLVFSHGNREISGIAPPEGSLPPGDAWQLVGVLPAEATPGDAPRPVDPGGVPVGSKHSEPIELTLDRDEAEGYYLNLTSPQPSLFALLRCQEVASATAVHQSDGIPDAEAVTASYSEAARWMDGGMVVVRTPLPQPLLPWIAEFAQHHFPVEGKRKRGGFRPSFLSRQEFGAVARSAREEKADDALAGAASGSGDGR
jgi:hypothetical protein